MSSRNPNRRQREIQRLLILEGAATVAELSGRFDVSEATIRRDLVMLEELGSIKRSHGGAAVQVMRPAEEVLAERERNETAAKRAIGRQARGLLESGQTAFLNDGTTMMALAREIAASDLELFLATPAINVASMLVENEKATVCLLGGFIRRTSLATGGPFAEATLDQLSGDIAFLSFDAFDPKDGGSFVHPENASLARKMVSRARRVVALVTARKLTQPGRILAVPPADIDVLITNADQPDLRSRLAERGIEVVVARE